MEKLPGDYIAGFVDGEGCFALKFIRSVRRERKNKPVYFYWDVEFAIVLRADDKEILEKIKYTLGCGKINVNKRGLARYSVEEINDLHDKVIPFFIKYPLQAKKKHDFLLWKEAVGILMRNRQKRLLRRGGFSKIEWKPEDFNRLIKIASEMSLYKSGNRKWKWLGDAAKQMI